MKMEAKPLLTNLSKHLREQGYDLINGPLRNYKLLQLWLKKPGNPAELYYHTLSHAFSSEQVLTSQINSALKVSARYKNEYQFNMGMSVLDVLLHSFGLNLMELQSVFSSGEKVSIAYEGSETQEVPLAHIENYMHTADYLHPNPSLFSHANRDQILLISGMLLAKNLVITIDTDFEISPEFIVEVDKKTKGALNAFKKSEKSIKMVSEGKSLFPVAVKAHRLHFDKGHFIKTNLVTDNRAFF